MRTLFILLRTEFLCLVNSINKKGKKQTPFVLAAVGLVLVGLFMIGMFAIMGGSTSYILVKKDLDELAIFFSLSLSMVIALMFGVMNSTRDARSNDTDMLLSMPIPKSSIVISKLLGMYLLDVLCAMVMLIPTCIILCTTGGHSYALFGRGILIGFLVPALPLFISLLVSALISFLRKATKFGQIIATVLSMGVLFLYMYFVPRITSIAENIEITPEESLSKMKMFPPFYWITEAVYSGDILYMALTLAMTLIPLALAVYIHARGLNGVDFHVDNSKKARVYKASSPRRAVLSMEFRRYFSSMNYIMNTLLGTIMLVGLTALIVFKGVGDITVTEPVNVDGHSFDITSKLIGIGWTSVWAILINAFATFTYTTPPSVSLEGKRIWLNKTLPIDTKDILLAKLMVSVMIFQPISIICSIVLSIASKSGFFPCLILILITSLFHLLTSMVGLIFGLIYVRLDWTNEAQVIKSGFAIVLTMIVNAVLALIVATPLGISFLVGKESICYLILGATIMLLMLLCWGSYAIISHYGVRKYDSLNG